MTSCPFLGGNPVSAVSHSSAISSVNLVISCLIGCQAIAVFIGVCCIRQSSPTICLQTAACFHELTSELCCNRIKNNIMSTDMLNK